MVAHCWLECWVVCCIFSTLDNMYCSRRFQLDVTLNQITLMKAMKLQITDYVFPKRHLLELKTCSPKNIIAILLHFSLPHVCSIVYAVQIGANPVGNIWLLLGTAGVFWLGSSWSLHFFIEKSTWCQLVIHFICFICFSFHSTRRNTILIPSKQKHCL